MPTPTQTRTLLPAVTERHRQTCTAVLEELAVEPTLGLTDTEAATRRAAVGENVLAETVRVPGWRRFVGQFRDLLILILIGASFVAFVVSGELKTPLVVLVVVLLNAVIGFPPMADCWSPTASRSTRPC